MPEKEFEHQPDLERRRRQLPLVHPHRREDQSRRQEGKNFKFSFFFETCRIYMITLNKIKSNNINLWYKIALKNQVKISVCFETGSIKATL
jgi:hypothetical protein